MGAVTSSFSEKSRLSALLEHFSQIEDPRDPWRVAHPLPEVLLLAVCGTIADCDDGACPREGGGPHRRLGRGASGVPAALPALSPRRAGWALADDPDEPDRSGAVLGLLHRLGARDLAGPARLRRHRRRSEERRLGKECVSTCRSRWTPSP